jgi:hypothetical protein
MLKKPMLFLHTFRKHLPGTKTGDYTEEGIKKMLETKVGNAAEINLFWS